VDTGFDCSGCNLVFYLFFKRQDYGPGGHYSGVFGKMNKRGDEHWGTISTLVLIFIAMIVIFFVYSDSFAEVKEGFVKIADTEAIKKAYSKTIGEESTLTEEEKKIIDEFNLFFRNNFAVIDDDCIKEINFNAIKEKGFGVRVRDGDIFAEKKGKARVYPLSVSSRLAFLNLDGGADGFFIDEEFENVNDRYELGDVVYVKDRKINFLDRATAAEFSGELSDVTQKKLCGTERGERLSIANIEFEDVKGINPEEARDIIAYLNDDFSYLGEDYQIHEMIKYLLDLGGLYKDGQLEKENERKHLFLINSMGKHVEEYFGEEYRGRFSINGCWNVIASIEGLSTVYGYGLAPDLLYRSAMITLSDGSAIRIIMLVKGECLPASKTTSLEYF